MKYKQISFGELPTIVQVMVIIFYMTIGVGIIWFFVAGILNTNFG